MLVIYAYIVFSSYEPAQMSNWCKLIKRTKVPSSSADTLQLAEYALKAKNNSLSFFCSVPTICLQSALCVVHCTLCCEDAGNAGKSVPAAAIHCEETGAKERFCGTQHSSWSQVPTWDKHHLTWNHGTVVEIRIIISNPPPFTPKICSVVSA